MHKDTIATIVTIAGQKANDLTAEDIRIKLKTTVLLFEEFKIVTNPSTQIKGRSGKPETLITIEAGDKEKLPAIEKAIKSCFVTMDGITIRKFELVAL